MVVSSYRSARISRIWGPVRMSGQSPHMKNDFPCGVWGVSDKGKQCLNQGQSGKIREGISADDRGTCCSNCMALPTVGLIGKGVRRANHGTQHRNQKRPGIHVLRR